MGMELRREVERANSWGVEEGGGKGKELGR